MTTAQNLNSVTTRGAEIGRIVVASKKTIAFRRTPEGLRQVGGIFPSPRLARRALKEAAKNG